MRGCHVREQVFSKLCQTLDVAKAMVQAQAVEVDKFQCSEAGLVAESDPLFRYEVVAL